MEAKRILGKRILLVEADTAARRILKLLLGLDQHTVTEAANGKQACLQYAPGDFDLVLTDFEMPEMKGDELARTIKCFVPAQPIIMITGALGTLASKDNPVNAVLIKPVTLDEMRACIAEVLSREAPQPSRSCSSANLGLGWG